MSEFLLPLAVGREDYRRAQDSSGSGATGLDHPEFRYSGEGRISTVDSHGQQLRDKSHHDTFSLQPNSTRKPA